MSPSQHRAGAQAGEVGAGIGLGEHRRRQDLARGDRRQPVLLLRLGAAGRISSAGDLRAGAERADADIAARQLLGDDAHRHLAQAEPALLLGHGQAEHAELGQLARPPPAGSARRAGASHGRTARPRPRRSGGTGRASSPAPRRPGQRAEVAEVEPSAISSARRSAHGRGVARDQLARPRGVLERRGIEAEIGRPHDLDLADRRCRRRAGPDIRRTPTCRISCSSSPNRPLRQPLAPSAASGAAPRHRSRSRRSRGRRTARARAACGIDLAARGATSAAHARRRGAARNRS